MISRHREKRFSQKVNCPFCPGGEEIPSKNCSIVRLQNKYPNLTPNNPLLHIKGDALYRRKSSIGQCEVIVYTPEHNTALANLSVNHIKKLVNLWADRFQKLGEGKIIKYVFIFENRGREAGASLDHPHCQIYAFPFIPSKIKKELKSSRQYMKRTGKCLFCQIIKKEVEDGSRVICENKYFICFLPFFAILPYNVHIYSRRHIQSFLDFSDNEKTAFAEILKEILTKLDNLFDFRFPYMMFFHQKPTDGRAYPYYHFHVEFCPPLQSKDNLKIFGSVESGAGAITCDFNPEEKAKQLREAKGYSPNLLEALQITM